MRSSLEFTAGAKANQRASIRPKPNPLAEPCMICGKWIAETDTMWEYFGCLVAHGGLTGKIV
jgi:hypothetical protein